MQKKAYKVLAYICEHRQSFMEAHFQDVLETIMAGGCPEPDIVGVQDCTHWCAFRAACTLTAWAPKFGGCVLVPPVPNWVGGWLAYKRKPRGPMPAACDSVICCF